MKAHASLLAMLLALQILPAASQPVPVKTAEEKAAQREDESDGRALQSEYRSAVVYASRPESYSVEKISETSKTLADGNQIKTRQSAMYYRDHKGRVRVVYKSNAGERIFIADTRAAVAYLIRPNRNDILRIIGEPPAMRLSSPSFSMVRAQEWSRKVETPLGVKEFEGLKAVGSRTETFYPAGAKGNEKEIVESREIWSSYVLPGYTYLRDTSPLTGERIDRFENLKLGDLPDSLFVIPDNLPIRDIVPGAPPSQD